MFFLSLSLSSLSLSLSSLHTHIHDAAHRLLKHPFLHNADKEATDLRVASTEAKWNAATLIALLSLKPRGDPYLQEIKSWIIQHRQDVMLLVDLGNVVVEGSWEWYAICRAWCDWVQGSGR
jgi:hypothetical protein